MGSDKIVSQIEAGVAGSICWESLYVKSYVSSAGKVCYIF